MFLSPLLREPGRRWRLEKADSRTVLAEPVEGAFDSASRRRGLLGRDGLGAAALVIAPCNLVHTVFMRFPIDIVFTDRDGLVLGVRHDVRPYRLSGAWGAFATIELAAGRARRTSVRRGDRLVLTPGDSQTAPEAGRRTPATGGV
jgi:uncharacterized membrane protein (UPF0127 family)